MYYTENITKIDTNKLCVSCIRLHISRVRKHKNAAAYWHSDNAGSLPSMVNLVLLPFTSFFKKDTSFLMQIYFSEVKLVIVGLNQNTHSANNITFEAK